VLVLAHPLYLFQDPGSPNVELFAPEKPTPARWLALLYTNRQLHAEASAALYRCNHFAFVDTGRKPVNVVHSFLHGIGSVNAGHLSHLCINFPVAQRVSGQEGKVILREADLHSLKLLQERCTSLATLEALVHGRGAKGLTVATYDSNNSHFTRETLSELDVQLKAIPSLGKTIVKFSDGDPAPEVVELMQHLGWVHVVGR
jgi:hypothetical protein